MVSILHYIMNRVKLACKNIAYPYSSIFVFLAALLLALSSSGCSNELPAENRQEQLIPVDINTDIAGMSIASSDMRSATRAVPSIVKTGFTNGDEMKLMLYESNGTSLVETTTIVYQSGKWLKKNADGSTNTFEYPRKYAGYQIEATYGTLLANGAVSTSDYMTSDKVSLTDNSTVLSTTLTFTHQYPCIEVVLNGSSHTYTAMTLKTPNNTSITADIPIGSPRFANLAGSEIGSIDLTDNSSNTYSLSFTPVTFKVKYYQFKLTVP